MLRNLEGKDLEKVKEIHAKSNLFPFPDLSSPLYCIQKGIEIQGELVGASFVHLTCEVGLILDPKLCRIKKARAIHEVFSSLHDEIKRFGLEDAHIFVVPESNEEFANLLVKNYKFARTPGITLERAYE